MTTNKEKLNQLKGLLEPRVFEEVLGRVNSLYKIASKVPFLDFPGLGAITGLDFISTCIDEILDELDSIDNNEYKRTVLEILDTNEIKLVELQLKVSKLTPYASITIENSRSSNVDFKHSHGILGVTDIGVNQFNIIFSSPLKLHDMYFPHCNVATQYISVNEHGIDVVLDNDSFKEGKLKIYLAWMGSENSRT